MLTKKSITPVISIVLLITLTISVVGVSYLWVNNFSQGFIDSANEQASEMDIQGQDLEILSLHGDYMTVRNYGLNNITE